MRFCPGVLSEVLAGPHSSVKLKPARLPATLRGHLNWRALNVAEGTEDATVARFRPKYSVTHSAFVEVHTGVRRHELFARCTAVRARERGTQKWSGR